MTVDELKRAACTLYWLEGCEILLKAIKAGRIEDIRIADARDTPFCKPLDLPAELLEPWLEELQAKLRADMSEYGIESEEQP